MLCVSKLLRSLTKQLLITSEPTSPPKSEIYLDKNLEHLSISNLLAQHFWYKWDFSVVSLTLT